MFDTRALSVFGFVAHKPITEDYVPLAPWAGVVFIGIALGNVLAAHSFGAVAPLATAPAWLRWLGRHSLAVYMVHQPILLGALWFVVGIDRTFQTGAFSSELVFPEDAGLRRVGRLR